MAKFLNPTKIDPDALKNWERDPFSSVFSSSFDLCPSSSSPVGSRLLDFDFDYRRLGAGTWISLWWSSPFVIESAAMARRKKDPMKDLKEAQKLPANKKCADCTEKVSRIAALLREALLSLCIQRELPASCLFLTRALGCCRPRSRLFPLASYFHSLKAHSFLVAVCLLLCHQFPQYANLTMNTFVCTACSGVL